METKVNGQPEGSYESRNELAIRSAAGDTAAEPRSNLSSSLSPKSSGTGQSSMLGSGTEQTEVEANLISHDSINSKQSSLNVLTAGPAKEISTPNKSREIAKSDTTNQAMVAQLPSFILRRNELFEKLKRQSHMEMLEKDKPEINVVLDLGLDKEGKLRAAVPVAAKAWESTPGSFLRHVDREVSSDVVIAKIDGKVLWDLDRPLEYGCRVSYVPFSSPEGRNVFWHSSAHVLGEACECQYNCLLSHGPPVEQGFFYDMAIAEG